MKIIIVVLIWAAVYLTVAFHPRQAPPPTGAVCEPAPGFGAPAKKHWSEQ